MVTISKQKENKRGLEITMITILISGIYQEKSLQATISSLIRSENKLDKKKKIVLVHHKPEIEDIQDEMLKDIDRYEKELQQKYPQQVDVVHMPEKNRWEALSIAIKGVKTSYVQILQAGDRYMEDTLEKSLIYMEQEATEVPILLFQTFDNRINRTTVLCAEQKIYDLNDPCQIRQVPLALEDCLIRMADWNKIMIAEEAKGRDLEESLLKLLDKKRKVAVMRGEYGKRGYIEISAREIEDPLACEDAYGKMMEQYYVPILEKYKDKYQNLPEFIQYYMMREIIQRFAANRNLKQKCILKGSEWEQFQNACKKVLLYLNDDVLFGYLDAVDDYKPGNALAYGLLDIKYGADLKKEFSLEEAEKIYVQLKINGRKLSNRLLPTIHLNLMEYENDTLHMEFFAPDFAGPNGIQVEPIFNGKSYTLKETHRYADVKFFGISMYRSFTFAIDLPVKELKERNSLHFVLKDNGMETGLPIINYRYTSKITSELPASYWCFGKYMVRFGGKGGQREIVINKAGKTARFLQEMRVLKNMFSGKKKNTDVGKMRLLYWLTHPYYKNKNIWLTFDKLYKGGDCGEYFYKYMCERKDTDVYPVYLINKEAKDRERLIKEGYTPVSRGSLRQKLLFLNAKMIFGTHVSITGFNCFQNEMLWGVQDRLQAITTCIQHGLTVQYLAFDAYRGYNNNKRYYCASQYEIQNLSQPEYAYDSSQLKLTGIPRYDGLVNHDQKQILITPTWRNYIAMPAVMGETRPYNPDFKHTDYFKIYNQLIHDPKLIETAKRTGYQLIYLLHPITSSQIEDYGQVENVTLIQATGVNYEKILCESSLMITDYSGVQFDFAYMRKPVVYYHPPKLPPHYEEGGFFYDTQGFGEICTDHQELVNTICAYMEQGCQLKDFYRERQDDFFAFGDHESCKRIFEDAWAYQNEQGRNWK